MQAGTHRGLAGGGKKVLLAGSSQQGSTPGKGVRGGLRWETNEMGLVYLWPCHSQEVLSVVCLTRLILMTNQRTIEIYICNGTDRIFTQKWASFELEMQSSMCTRVPDRQIHTCGGYCALNVQLHKHINM